MSNHHKHGPRSRNTDVKYRFTRRWLTIITYNPDGSRETYGRYRRKGGHFYGLF